MQNGESGSGSVTRQYNNYYSPTPTSSAGPAHDDVVVLRPTALLFIAIIAMPTAHRVSRSFLLQIGVRRPPQNADQIRSQLRRDPDYFSFLPSRTADESDAANDDGIGYVSIKLSTGAHYHLH